MEKTGFIYIWYDRKRKMYYIGCHWGTIDDGYICSSNRMRAAYRRRPQEFKRRIVQTNIERNMLLEEEYKWLSLISKDDLGKKYYNLSQRHFGHWSLDEILSKDVGNKIGTKLRGKKQSIETIEKRIAGREGYRHSEETKEKMSNSQKGKIGHSMSIEAREKLRLYNTGKKLSVEHKLKIKNSLMGHNVTQETKEKISESKKK